MMPLSCSKVMPPAGVRLVCAVGRKRLRASPTALFAGTDCSECRMPSQAQPQLALPRCRPPTRNLLRSQQDEEQVGAAVWGQRVAEAPLEYGIICRWQNEHVTAGLLYAPG